nr:hypothetical protein [Candidatus Goldiibacteriota bacterium]
KQLSRSLNRCLFVPSHDASARKLVPTKPITTFSIVRKFLNNETYEPGHNLFSYNIPLFIKEIAVFEVGIILAKYYKVLRKNTFKI